MQAVGERLVISDEVPDSLMCCVPQYYYALVAEGVGSDGLRPRKSLSDQKRLVVKRLRRS